MTSIDNVRKIAEQFDHELTDNHADQSETPILGEHRKQFEQIEALKKFQFEPYLNDDVQDFFGKFLAWINQFETNEEKKLGFKIASHIALFTEDQIKYLQEVCFQEKLVYKFLDLIIEEKNLAAYDYQHAGEELEEFLGRVLIVPLTDSARYNQFVHVNGLENHSSLGLKSIDVLVHPDIRSTPEVVSKLKARYKEKTILVIIEDFCGSGKTFLSDYSRIVGLYDNFKKIFFCPYIITERALKVIEKYSKRYCPDITFEILFGATISDEMRVFSKSNAFFTDEEKRSIAQLCIKYHDKYFKDHKYIGNPRRFPFGYRDGQLLVVLQSNCPNHTLPIIWAYDNNWKPLFKRVQRYS